MKSAQPKPTSMRRHRSQRGATDSVTRLIRRAQRAGFTLVELLMVIVIIGILVGMLAVAINPVLQTARETTVITEMKQMDLAIENFNNKYGFYPPSFSGLGSAAALLPFLNKISPNHRENQADPALGGRTRLAVWWDGIGRHLDDRGSLIFWLSGLGRNKQFPITGNLPLVGGDAQLPVIFNADLAILVDPTNGDPQRGEANITGGSFERESQFDFRVEQLSTELPGGGQAVAGVRIYNQPHGNSKGNLAYAYRNAAFYDLGALNGSAQDNDSPAHPSRSNDAFYVRVTPGPSGRTGQIFPNPRTFQLVTAGLDGEVAFGNINRVPINPADVLPEDAERIDATRNNDNIANFASGRLDGFDWSEAVELGGREPQ